jgi:hypothetical protein
MTGDVYDPGKDAGILPDGTPAGSFGNPSNVRYNQSDFRFSRKPFGLNGPELSFPVSNKIRIKFVKKVTLPKKSLSSFIGDKRLLITHI